MYEPGLVSVIVPTYNRAGFLEEAVESVLTQTYTRHEVVIVDDGSTDGTASLAVHLAEANAGVRAIITEHSGPASARNTGIKESRGEFVCFLDSDDVYLPTKLEDHCAFLAAHSEVDLVYSDFASADAELAISTVHHTGLPGVPFDDVLALRPWFAITACTIRRDLLDLAGMFATDLDGVEDWELWIRCARQGTFGYVPGVVTLYRRHDAQFHDNYELLRASRKATIRRHFSSPTKLRRRAWAGFYWHDAMSARLARRHLRLIASLIRFAAAARSPAEMRAIVRLCGR